MKKPRAALSKAPSLAQLKSDIDTLERVVVRLRLITPEEQTANKPGGEDNADLGYAGHLRYLIVLNRRHAKLELDAQRDSEMADDATVLAALNETPLRIELPKSDGMPEEVFVYPKSFHALVDVHTRDYLLGWLVSRAAKLKQRGTAQDADLLMRVQREITFQYSIIIWVATHPGPGLPYDDVLNADRLIVPKWIMLLDPLMMYHVFRKYMTVNVRRLHAVSSLVPPQEEASVSSRPRWSIFFGTLANERNDSATRLMRDRSLGSLMAEVSLAAGAHREAMEKASPKKERMPTGVTADDGR